MQKLAKKPFIKPRFIKHEKVQFKYRMLRESLLYWEGRPETNNRQFLIFGEVQSSNFNSYYNPEKPTFYYEIVPTGIAEKDLKREPAISGWLEACKGFTVTVEESKLSLVLD